MTYAHGERSGIWIIYNEAGEVLSEKEYDK
jgi:antitoxin component YwqK of YwqJK toxin-antitoxin module